MQIEVQNEDSLEPLSVTVKTAKRISGLGHTTLYEMIAAGSLLKKKVGRRTLIDYASLKAAVTVATDQVAA